MINYSPSHVGRKKDGELWSTNKKFIGAPFDPPKLRFSGDYISAFGGCWPLKFLHTLQIDQGMLAHPRAALRWALPHISSFYLFRHAISELPRPIAAKLCHMIAIWVRFIMQVLKFGGPSPKRNWGAKTCKIRRDFRRLQTSSANISGTGEDIQNRKSN